MCLEGLHPLAVTLKRSEQWRKFILGGGKDTNIPSGWDAGLTGESDCEPRNKLLYACLVAKALVPDRLPAYLTILVQEVMGKDFINIPEFNLEAELKTIAKNTTPLMMVSAPGFDPSGTITALANAQKRKMQSIAMGSEEGFAQADKLIIQAAKQGFWVVLKNVHLAINWLSALDKKLYTISSSQVIIREYKKLYTIIIARVR